MGILSCRWPCVSDNDNFHSYSNQLLDHSESSTNSSLSSQPSLPSVPSLTSSKYFKQNDQQRTPSTHHNCIATIDKAHSSYISSLVLSGKFIYSGSSNSEIRIWNRDPSLIKNSTSDILVAITNSAVKSMVVSGDKLFSAHQDHKIRVWKIDNNNNKSKSNQTHKYYKCIATLPTFHDRFSRFFSDKNYVQVRRHKKCTWVHHVDAVSALAISQDGSLLYSVSWDRTFKVWRTSDFKCLESVSKAHDDAINAIALSKDGYVYTGSADKKIKVRKKLNGHKKHSLMATLEKHNSAVNALALSSDGLVLYSGACDRSILVWERDVGNDQNGHMVLVGALRGHTKAILCLGVVMDLLCSGSADFTLRIWRRGVDMSYSCLAVLEGHKRPVKCLIAIPMPLDFNKDGDESDDSKSGGASYLVYSGSLDCVIKVWKIQVVPFLS